MHAEDLSTLQDCERCLQWVLDNVYRAGVPLQCTRSNLPVCPAWGDSIWSAGDVIHLFHVVTHNTARSLECFSTPQEDLPPERHHQEMLVSCCMAPRDLTASIDCF